MKVLGSEKRWIYLDGEGHPFMIKGEIVSDLERDEIFEEHYSLKAVQVDTIYQEQLEGNE